MKNQLLSNKLQNLLFHNHHELSENLMKRNFTRLLIYLNLIKKKKKN